MNDDFTVQFKKEGMYELYGSVCNKKKMFLKRPLPLFCNFLINTWAVFAWVLISIQISRFFPINEHKIIYLLSQTDHIQCLVEY